MKKQNLLLLILGIIQVMVAVGALPVGYLFIIHPDGSALGMDIKMLANYMDTGTSLRNRVKQLSATCLSHYWFFRVHSRSDFNKKKVC